MDLAAIKAFVAVGDHLGFRAAAAVLGTTSAAVSKAVARLETAVGSTLVARTTRTVRLTPAGSLFHARCKAILADLAEASREAGEGAAIPRGRLVVSMTRAFGRLRILPVIADFAAMYTEVDLEARSTDRPVDLVAEGVDAAVRIGDLPDSELVSTRVGATRFMLCGSPDYLAAHGTPTRPDDLHHHVMVGYVTPDTAIQFEYRFLVGGEPRTLSVPARVRVDDGEMLVGLAARSSGPVMANEYLMESYLADGRLVRLLAEFEFPPVAISVVRPAARTPSAAVRAFTAMLSRRLSNNDGQDSAAYRGRQTDSVADAQPLLLTSSNLPFVQIAVSRISGA